MMKATLLVCLLGIALVSARPGRSRRRSSESANPAEVEGANPAELEDEDGFGGCAAETLGAPSNTELLGFIRNSVLPAGGELLVKVTESAASIMQVIEEAAEDVDSKQEVNDLLVAFYRNSRDQVRAAHGVMEAAGCLARRIVEYGIEDGDAPICVEFLPEEAERKRRNLAKRRHSSRTSDPLEDVPAEYREYAICIMGYFEDIARERGYLDDEDSKSRKRPSPEQIRDMFTGLRDHFARILNRLQNNVDSEIAYDRDGFVNVIFDLHEVGHGVHILNELAEKVGRRGRSSRRTQEDEADANDNAEVKRAARQLLKMLQQRQTENGGDQSTTDGDDDAETDSISTVDAAAPVVRQLLKKLQRRQGGEQTTTDEDDDADTVSTSAADAAAGAGTAARQRRVLENVLSSIL